METIVADHASRLVYKLKGRMQSYDWRGKKEVDVVIKLGTIPIPIEVKYQEHPDEIGGVKEFMNEFDTGIGIVVTKILYGLMVIFCLCHCLCSLLFVEGCFCFNYKVKGEIFL